MHLLKLYSERMAIGVSSRLPRVIRGEPLKFKEWTIEPGVRSFTLYNSAIPDSSIFKFRRLSQWIVLVSILMRKSFRVRTIFDQNAG